MSLKFDLTVSVMCAILSLFADTAQQQPEQIFHIGPYRLAYNFTKPDDKLSPKRVAIDLRLSDRRYPNISIMVMLERSDQLVPCDGLFPDTPEMESLIDCKPKAAQYSEAGQASQSEGYHKSYAIQTRFRAKYQVKDGPPGSLKIKLDFLKIQTDVLLYPLVEDFTQQTIRRVLKVHKMETGTGFEPEATSLGYHMVYSPLKNLNCNANLFLSINSTSNIKVSLLTDTKGGSGGFHQLIDDFVKKGGFFSVQDVVCTHPTMMMPIWLDADFTLIHRKQFPYVTCTHHIITKPINSLWTYEGSIEQTKDDLEREAYNTTIKVDSTSLLFENWNLKIDQTFVNKDLLTGFEQMFLIHPRVSAVVRSDWAVDSLVKSVGLFFKGDEQYNKPVRTNEKSPNEEPDIWLSYEDKPDDKYLKFNLNIERNYLNSLSSLLGTWKSSIEVEKNSTGVEYHETYAYNEFKSRIEL